MDRGGSNPKSGGFFGNSSLLLASVLVTFAAIEIGYRLFDPFPYVDSTELARNEAVKLVRYDPLLGWAGVPGAKGYVVTDNKGVWVELNRLGFRDIEHDESDSKKPAVVFLGDSFTEGHEVESGEMFSSLLRRMLPQYEVYVLAQRGWGTDQQYLAFKQWRVERKVATVVLMICSNDIAENNRSYRHRVKPQFRFESGQLVLTNVPVPERPPEEEVRAVHRPTWLKEVLYRSHFLHDVGLRLGLADPLMTRSAQDAKSPDRDPTVTIAILGLLRSEVLSRRGTLLVAAIPTTSEILGRGGRARYQPGIEKACAEIGIDYLDLGPSFKKTWFRTNYRFGEHWNAHGHEVAAEALHEYLRRQDGSP